MIMIPITHRNVAAAVTAPIRAEAHAREPPADGG